MDWQDRIQMRQYYELTQFTHLFWRAPSCNLFCLIPAEVPCECLTGILGNTLIGPFIIEDRMRGEDYLNFVADVVMLTFDDMPLQSRWHLWYQLGGAPAHFTLLVCEWLDHHFPARWIGRGGPVVWPARSPDLTPLNYFLWGCMKEKVYETEIASRERPCCKD